MFTQMQMKPLLCCRQVSVLFCLLFTGDAGETAEQQMTETGRLDAVDVLKTGHHGSRYATSESFLQYIKAAVCGDQLWKKEPVWSPT